MLVTIPGLAAEKARHEIETRKILDGVARELESGRRPFASEFSEKIERGANWNRRAIAALRTVVEYERALGNTSAARRAARLLEDFEFAFSFQRVECCASVPDGQRCRGVRPRKLPRHHGVSAEYARSYMGKHARDDRVVVDAARGIGYTVAIGERACQTEEEAGESRKRLRASKLKGLLGMQSFVVPWERNAQVVVVLILPAGSPLTEVASALNLDRVSTLTVALGEVYGRYWHAIRALGPERAVARALRLPKGRRLFHGNGCFTGKRRKALMEAAAGLAVGAEADRVIAARANAEAAAEQAELARKAQDARSSTLAASYASGWAREAGLAARGVPAGVVEVGVRAHADLASAAARAARRSRTRANRCVSEDGTFVLELEPPPGPKSAFCKRHRAELRLVDLFDVGEHGERAEELARWRNLPVGTCDCCGGDLEAGEHGICSDCWERR